MAPCPICLKEPMDYFMTYGKDDELRLAAHVFSHHREGYGKCFCGRPVSSIFEMERHLIICGGLTAHWLEVSLGVQDAGRE